MGSAEPIADGMTKMYAIDVWVELCEDIQIYSTFRWTDCLIVDLCSLDAPKHSQC